jgi:hypothetical protein
MNLSQALKKKNRLAGELVRQQRILERENARRSDSVSTVNREEVWNKILDLSAQLGDIKGKITVANVGIYPSLERMAELKSRVAWLMMLTKRQGEEIVFVGRDQERLTYIWNSFIAQEKADALVSELQTQIDTLQDSIDQFNTNHQIDD